MNCNKCSEILVLRHQKATLHFLCEFQELISKINDFFYTLGVKCTNESGLCTVDVDDKKAFFTSNLDAFESFFQ